MFHSLHGISHLQGAREIIPQSPGTTCTRDTKIINNRHSINNRYAESGSALQAFLTAFPHRLTLPTKRKKFVRISP